MSDPTQTLNRCPFCPPERSQPNLTKRSDATNFVECLCCMATGPLCGDEPTAIRTWNEGCFGARQSSEIWDVNAERSYTAKELQEALDGRDEFIVSKGLWDEFARQLDGLKQQAQPAGDAPANDAWTAGVKAGTDAFANGLKPLLCITNALYAYHHALPKREAQPADIPGDFKCLYKNSGAGGNDPQDCDWPVCGCDPYADKVIAALEDGGIQTSVKVDSGKPKVRFDAPFPKREIVAVDKTANNSALVAEQPLADAILLKIAKFVAGENDGGGTIAQIEQLALAQKASSRFKINNIEDEKPL